MKNNNIEFNRENNEKSIKRNLKYFKKSINENIIDAFFWFQKTKEDKERFFDSNFTYFTTKLKDLYTFVTKNNTTEPKFF